ncbi:MAG: hypothetical protein ACT6RD_12595 [Brevundimonas sp.]|uniref:hypothetical protein n=1 Tax=Brevundimonas sp. TaxID=1871086 RepID=UPI0040344E50
MKRLILAAALASTALLAGCEDPAPAEVETAQPPVEAVPVESPPPVAEPEKAETPPADPSALPPDARSSEETVKPESETLFY